MKLQQLKSRTEQYMQERRERKAAPYSIRDDKINTKITHRKMEMAEWARQNDGSEEYEVICHRIIDAMVDWTRKANHAQVKLNGAYSILELAEKYEEVDEHIRYGQHADYLVETTNDCIERLNTEL